jgi:hypothetical protein
VVDKLGFDHAHSRVIGGAAMKNGMNVLPLRCFFDHLVVGKNTLWIDGFSLLGHSSYRRMMNNFSIGEKEALTIYGFGKSPRPS